MQLKSRGLLVRANGKSVGECFLNDPERKEVGRQEALTDVRGGPDDVELSDGIVGRAKDWDEN